MNSKLQYIENLRRRGFTENFASTASYAVLGDNKRIYKPSEIKIASFYTYSNEEDPKDYSIMYALETIDGKKGIFIDSHCESPDEKVEGFINSIKTAKLNGRKNWFIHPLEKMFRVKFSINA